jgi:hypothetical protein
MKIEFFSDIFNTSRQNLSSHPELVFAAIDEYNLELQRRYFAFRNRRTSSLGWYVLRDVAVTDNWGIVYDPATGLTPVLLPGFGWQREHLEFAAGKGTISIVENLEPHLAVGPVIQSHVGASEIGLTEPVYLLSWPGALTFGHWITDVIGRMELAARHGSGTRKYLSPNPFRP